MQSSGWFSSLSSALTERQVIIGALVVALVALALRQPLIALLAIAVALAIGVTLIWRRYGLHHVEYRRHFSRSRVFPGEAVTLEISLENAKFLPLPWIEIQDDFPDRLEFPDLQLQPSTRPRTGIFRTFFSTRPFERVRRRYHVICPRRGYYRFGPAVIRTGDLFGFSTQMMTDGVVDYLTVYPVLVPVTAFRLPAKQPFGDDKPSQPLLEDPLRFRGVRPYSPGDAPRRIHWRASARSTELQAKQYEQSATPTLALFLDVNTFERFWQGLDPERLERAISATASLADHGLSEGRQVGLYANAPRSGGEQFIRIAPGRHPAQLGRILQALSMLVPFTGYRIETLIANEARRLPWGATIVVVTGYVSSALEERLAALRRTGHAITLISFAERSTDLPSRPGFTVYWLGEEVASDAELAQLELA